MVRDPSAKVVRIGREAPRETKPRALASVPIGEAGVGVGDERIATGLKELDRILVGGFPLGKTLIFGGGPGAGKSTLLMQAVGGIARRNRALYATSEEFREDLAKRARQLAAEEPLLNVLDTKSLDVVAREVEAFRPKILVVDSINKFDSREGRQGAHAIVEHADAVRDIVRRARGEMTALVVAHVVKSGEISGPNSLQHDLDGTFYLEKRTDRIRRLRALKYRGNPLLSGLFEMRREGLFEIRNPSEHFLAERVEGMPGSVVAPLLEEGDTEDGSGCALVELQALAGVVREMTTSSTLTCTGVSKKRAEQTALLLADALGQIGIDPEEMCRTIYLNVPGGADADEPAMDLAIALAVTSRILDRAIDPRTTVFGEIGLVGEIRSVPATGARIREAKGLGFRHVVAPRGARAAATAEGVDLRRVEIEEVRTLAEAIEAVFPAEAIERAIERAEERRDERVEEGTARRRPTKKTVKTKTARKSKSKR